LRTFLAILTACAAFTMSLAALFPFAEFSIPKKSEALDPAYVAILLTSALGFLAVFWIVIAGGVLAMQKTGLRSHALDRIRGNAPPKPGRWMQTALIGLVACLPAAFASAAIRTWWPGSFTEEPGWRDYGIGDVLERAAAHLCAGMIGWVGLLNLFALGCLKAFGAERRMCALAVAIALTELLGLGAAAALAAPLDEPLGIAVCAEAAAWSLLTITGAWLYVTRALEHGLLALMWSPVVIIALRPLWAHLGI